MQQESHMFILEHLAYKDLSLEEDEIPEGVQLGEFRHGHAEYSYHGDENELSQFRHGTTSLVLGALATGELTGREAAIFIRTMHEWRTNYTKVHESKALEVVMMEPKQRIIDRSVMLACHGAEGRLTTAEVLDETTMLTEYFDYIDAMELRLVTAEGYGAIMTPEGMKPNTRPIKEWENSDYEPFSKTYAIARQLGASTHADQYKVKPITNNPIGYTTIENGGQEVIITVGNDYSEKFSPIASVLMSRIPY